MFLLRTPERDLKSSINVTKYDAKKKVDYLKVLVDIYLIPIVNAPEALNGRQAARVHMRKEENRILYLQFGIELGGQTKLIS